MFESAVQDPLPHIHAQNVMKKKGSTLHIGTNDTSKGIDAHNFRSRPSVKEEFSFDIPALRSKRSHENEEKVRAVA